MGFIRPVHRLQEKESYDVNTSLDTKQFSRISLLRGKVTVIFESNDSVSMDNIIYMAGTSQKSLSNSTTKILEYMLVQVSNGNKIETRKISFKRYYAVPEDKLEQSVIKILKNLHYIYDEKTGDIVNKKQK